MTTRINGELEIDHERGVVYFHRSDTGTTFLRICKLPDIPEDATFIDITRASEDQMATCVVIKQGKPPESEKTEKKDSFLDFTTGKVKQIDID